MNQEDSPSTSILTELTIRMDEFLAKTRSSTPTTETSAAPIGIKLDGTNYDLWSQIVEIYISGKDKAGTNSKAAVAAATGTKSKAAVGSSGRLGKAAAEPSLSLSLVPPVDPSSVAAYLSDTGTVGHARASTHQDENCGRWLLDSGATNHMTWDPTDFITTYPPRRMTSLPPMLIVLRTTHANNIIY